LFIREVRRSSATAEGIWDGSVDGRITHHRSRVKSMIQFVSQLPRPAGEKACSQRAVEAVMLDQM
jgi:hypothetical protein